MKFYLFMMPGMAVTFVFHIFEPVFSYSPDVSFLMERHPDNYFCGHLQCVADLTKSDHDVSSLVEITIYDITRVNSDLKLVSVSIFHPDLYVDTTKSSAMSCTGIISRHQANLTVQLRHDIDCLYGVYKCQLDVVTASGLSEVLTEILTPELNHNYSRMAEIISHFSRLTELLNSHIVHVNNQTAQINRLVNQLDDQTALINRLDSQLDDQTAQLTDQKAQLNNISSRLEQAEQNQIHEVTQEWLKKFEVKLDTVEQLSNETVEILHDQGKCTKGQPHINGLTKIILLGNISVLCDTVTDGGGWILIQRRSTNLVDFYRSWTECQNGFGTPDTDFWIGNDVIHNLTSQGFSEIRIDLNYNNKRYYAHYSSFSIANESMNYRLSVGGYSGTAGDSLGYHNNMNFSTFDRDNDRRASENCAVNYNAAWWFNACHRSNLNGLWGRADYKGLHWRTITGANSATFSEMKIRRP